MKILIGNKNYSSWSLRPWLVLAHFAIPFDEEVLPLSGEGWKARLRTRSPSGRVPVLLDGDLVLPETIAIIEYLADTHPHKPIWPADTASRALARSASAEMHGGFSQLRNLAPMNLRASGLWHCSDEFWVHDDIAHAFAFIILSDLKIRNPLPCPNGAIDHPVERSLPHNFIATLGHHASAVHNHAIGPAQPELISLNPPVDKLLHARNTNA